jgi:hypothetical protein
MIDRGYSNHAAIDTEPPKLFNWFRDEATAHLILVRREKWSESQDVQRWTTSALRDIRFAQSQN